ncbi:LysR family transcriptional regulator [Alloyangia pacifica]|uniref:LysR family transcriptional regulator n=1 Tax=Alloyangia pacifica TaxID=311180 RepID=A0A2U8HIV9_9RHOB|nr:LysR family transcriptional regulator [Alloyangia pacifica]AWI85774.1 LysR family transcriptional regulator [Alloyangia pacifica]
MSISERPDVGWDDQRAFLAVIDGGSLSEAARRLGLSQPTVRARIACLEKALGSALFTRAVNGMVPTKQALALAMHVRAMQRASDALVRAASAPSDAIAGVVRLSVSEVVGMEVMPSMLASLRAVHPELRVELILSNTSANLLEQEVDVAIRMTPPKQKALVARKVATIPLGFYAHRRYLEARGVPATIAEFSTHDLIGPDRSRRDLLFASQIFPELPPERFVLRTDSHPAHLAAARAGLGIAVAQVPLARRYDDLVRVLPDLQVAALETWIVLHEDLRDTPRVRALRDHLAAAFVDFGRG